LSAVERVDLATAYLLHAMPYRESSQIIEALTQQHGRVGLVARGSRRRGSRWSSLLQPFRPLRLSWSGRGGLFTLRAAEAASPPFTIGGISLMSAYYLNELLLALTHRGDPHPDLFAHYAHALAALGESGGDEVALRGFEIALLDEIGYGLVFNRDATTDGPLDPDRHYHYVIEQGPVPVAGARRGDMVFSGAELMSIGRGDYSSGETLGCAKRLLRQVIHHHLGGRPLKTREVLASMRR